MEGWILAVIGIPTIFILGFVGSCLPPLCRRMFPKWDMANSIGYLFLNGFASGTIIAVGFVHSFPEGINGIGENLGEFPFGGLFALVAALMTFMIESLMEVYMHRDHESKEEEISYPDEDGNTENIPADIRNRFYSEMVVLMIGLCFHSFFVGFALGLVDNDLGLLLAILAHQFFEGIALGIRIVRVSFRKSITIFILDFVFAIMTPFGIEVGLWIKTAVSNNPTTYEIIQGVFNCFSAGILIYVGLVHMLAEEAHREEVLRSPKRYLTLCFGVILGATCMTLLAIWA